MPHYSNKNSVTRTCDSEKVIYRPAVSEISVPMTDLLCNSNRVYSNLRAGAQPDGYQLTTLFIICHNFKLFQSQ